MRWARATGAIGLLAAALAAWSCRDGLGPGAPRRVQLAIVPIFSGSSPHDGTVSDVDSFVLELLNPPDTIPRVVVARIPPGQDSIVVTVTVDIGGTLDTIVVAFRGYNSTSRLLLYQGSQQLIVRAGVSETQQVPASYVGPGQGLDSVIVAPTAIGLAPGGTIQLTYTGYRGTTPLSDDSVPVRYRSADSAVARVSAAGLVTAVAVGQARVFVTSLARSSIEDTCLVTVSTTPPLIGLSPGTVTFNDTAGTSNPAPATVNVTNAGGGTLSGLAVGTITYGAGASGWLTATLAGTTAPTTLTFAASNAGLSAGTYTATVPVSAPGASNTPQNVTVTFVLAPSPLTAIVVSPGFGFVRTANTLTLSVSGRDASGNTVSVSGVTFTSRTTSVATVNSTSGVVTGVAVGLARIVATAGSLGDSLIVGVLDSGRVGVSAIGDSRSFDLARVGDTVRVLVAADLSAVSPDKLGSYTAQLGWTTSVLRYVRSAAVSGGFAAPTINELQASSGQLSFGAADPNGAAGPTVGLISVVFVGNGTGFSSLALTLSDLSGVSPTYTQWCTATSCPHALVFGAGVRVQ